MNPFSLLLPIFWYIYLHMFLAITTSALGNHIDHLALLKFRESISKDPYGVLDSWNSSTHLCNWRGITCNSMHQRVTELNLYRYGLQGTISPQVGNLSFLRYLDLRSNNFYNTIPQELGRLVQLEKLFLNNNSLAGEFPTNLTSCSELKGLSLYRNNLIGKIPVEIGSLRKLQLLTLRTNKFTGRIPASIGNLSSLTLLDVSENNLEGNIPQEIGHLRNLTEIMVHVNKLNEGVFRNASAFAMTGNGKLCGGVLELHLPPCPEKDFVET